MKRATLALACLAALTFSGCTNEHGSDVGPEVVELNPSEQQRYEARFDDILKTFERVLAHEGGFERALADAGVTDLGTREALDRIDADDFNAAFGFTENTDYRFSEVALRPESLSLCLTGLNGTYLAGVDDAKSSMIYIGEGTCSTKAEDAKVIAQADLDGETLGLVVSKGADLLTDDYPSPASKAAAAASELAAGLEANYVDFQRYPADKGKALKAAAAWIGAGLPAGLSLAEYASTKDGFTLCVVEEKTQSWATYSVSGGGEDIRETSGDGAPLCGDKG